MKMVNERARILARPAPGEKPDPRPVEIPIGHGTPESFETMMQRFVTNAINTYREAQDVAPAPEEDVRKLDLDEPLEGEEPDITTGYSMVQTMEGGTLTMEEVAAAVDSIVDNPPPEVTDSSENEGKPAPAADETSENPEDPPQNEGKP